MTKYVSKDYDCVDKTRKFGALLAETLAKWKVLKCEQVKIADHLNDIFNHKSVQLFSTLCDEEKISGQQNKREENQKQA